MSELLQKLRMYFYKNLRLILPAGGLLLVLLTFTTVLGIWRGTEYRRVNEALQQELGQMDRESRLQVAYMGSVALSDAETEETAGSEEQVRMITPQIAEAVEDVWTPSGEIAESYSPAFSNSEVTRRVYLTFDDGPSIYTDDILDILQEYGVKATFFVVGRTSEANQERYRRIVEEGHTLGMHSYSHKYNEVYGSRESFLLDLERIKALLTASTGRVPEFYRFPGGSSNTISGIDMHVFGECLEEQGITYFDWNVAAGDATEGGLSADQIVSNCLQGIEKREVSVVLMHDAASRYTTVQALPRLIEALQEMDGVEILPITDETPVIQHVELN